MGWVCLALGLAACAPAEDGNPGLLAGAKDTFIGVCKDAFGALQMPLEDLNIKREPIPEKLQGCAANPYSMPLPPLCYNIQIELAELDTLLGPDMDPAPLPWLARSPSARGYIEKGIKEVPSLARQQAAGMVRGKVDVIPFRGVVRRVTGAEKHTKEVTHAYEAGRLRRAFLKGVAKASGCASLPDSINR